MLVSKIETYLHNSDLFPNFSDILNIKPSIEEVKNYKKLAKEFKDGFNQQTYREAKIDSLRRKLYENNIKETLESTFDVTLESLQDVIDYT